MANRNVISVHTQPDTAVRLDALAAVTRRSRSFLANEAIERYLAEEESFVEAVLEGIADADAGKLSSTEEMQKFILDSLAE